MCLAIGYPQLLTLIANTRQLKRRKSPTGKIFDGGENNQKIMSDVKKSE
jgi:hypothetical protein